MGEVGGGGEAGGIRRVAAVVYDDPPLHKNFFEPAHPCIPKKKREKTN